jgi:hypothetical protein
MSIRACVDEALALSSSSKTKYFGTIQCYDHAGTTVIIIRDDGHRFFAFPNRKHPVKPGDHVTFRVSGPFAAFDVRIEEKK